PRRPSGVPALVARGGGGGALRRSRPAGAAAPGGRGRREDAYPPRPGVHQGEPPTRDRAPPALARDLLPPARGIRPPQKRRARVGVRRARSLGERCSAFEAAPHKCLVDSKGLAAGATRRRVAPELPMSEGSRSLLEVSR